MKKTSSDLDTIITKSSEIRILNFGKFPVGPVVRTLCFHCSGHRWVRSLGELKA